MVNISKKQLPLWLDRKKLHRVASWFEEETTEEEKFKHLQKRDVSRLIQSHSVLETSRKATTPKHKRNLDKLLLNTALLTLDNKYFINDIVEFARRHNLATIKYSLEAASMFSNPKQIVMGAWEFRLQYLSLINFSRKLSVSEKDTAQIFADTFLPPKFEKKLLALMDEHGLEFFWYESILLLLLTGIWYLPKNTTVIHLNLDLKESHFKGGTASISLEISSLTTAEEIKNRWQEVDSLQKQVFPSTGKRKKPGNLKEVYTARFEKNISALANSQCKNIKSRKVYTNNLRAINRKLKRSRQAHSEFLKQYKKIPTKVLFQIEQSYDWGRKSVYFF